MIGNNQDQRSGDYSTNIQAKGDVTVYQPDEGLIRSIVEHQIRGQLATLTNDAYDIYKARCTAFSDGLVHAFSHTYELKNERLREPSVQFSINDAHRAYGETGDDELKETLITIVGKMCSTESRHLDRLYKDAIEITSKLSSSQINLLCLIGSIYYITNSGISSIDDLVEKISLNIDPIIDHLPMKKIELEHLQYLGLSTYERFGSRTIHKMLTLTYAGLFQKGFDKSELESFTEENKPSLHHFIPCLNDTNKLQTKYMNMDVLNSMCPVGSIKDEAREFIVQRMSSNVLTAEEIDALISIKFDNYKRLLQYFKDFDLDKFFLTTVGQIIAVIRIEAVTGSSVDISGWA